MAQNPFITPLGGINTEHYAITPSDTVNFPIPFTGIYVGGAGNIAIVSAQGTVVVYTAVPAGTQLWVYGVRVNITLTTATLMVGLS